MPADLAEVRPFLILLAGVVGGVFGSFLNVCILRWGAEPKQSVVRPPSRCPRCGAGVAWYDNAKRSGVLCSVPCCWGSP